MKHLVNHHDETFGKSRMVKNTYTLQEDYNVSKKKKNINLHLLDTF